LVEKLVKRTLFNVEGDGAAGEARNARNRKHAGEQQLFHQYLPLANIEATPRIVPAIT